MKRLWSTSWAEVGTAHGGMGLPVGCRGKVFGDCTRFIKGCLRGGTEARKGKVQGGLVRNTHGKTDGKGENGLVIYKQVTDWSVGLCSQAQHLTHAVCLSLCLFIKLHF